MQINKILLVFTITVVFILGIFVGIITNNTQEKEGPNISNIFPKSCNYNGKIYKPGEGFKDVDGCNSCSCENGQVSCTLMACP